jgi:glycosyltransferase involved in cell wall biosynthesis
MPFDRVFLGYDAVDNDYFANRTAAVRRQPATFRSQSRLPETYFLASARSVEKKNLPRLLQAYARYRDLHRKSTTPALQKPLTSQLSTLNLTVLPHQPSTSPWSLVLLGDGPLRNSAPERSGVPLRNSLNSQLATLNLQSSVHLPGFKQYDELPTYYGLAGAFVHASTTEPWGLVVNEAMASGLPVLVSNRCGCAPDLVQEGRNGFTFAPLNVDELAGLMLKLAAMPREQLADMGNAGREIISHWGPDRFAAGLRQAVELALRLPRPRPTALDRMLLWTLARRKNSIHRNLQ